MFGEGFNMENACFLTSCINTHTHINYLLWVCLYPYMCIYEYVYVCVYIHFLLWEDVFQTENTEKIVAILEGISVLGSDLSFTYNILKFILRNTVIYYMCS